MYKKILVILATSLTLSYAQNASANNATLPRQIAAIELTNTLHLNRTIAVYLQKIIQIKLSQSEYTKSQKLALHQLILKKFSIDKINSIIAKIFAENLPTNEMLQLIKYYRNPIIQSYILTQQEVLLAKIQKEIKQQVQPLINSTLRSTHTKTLP